MRRLLFAAVSAALAAGGCAARAKTPVVPVALVAPAPPPRIIVPPEPELPETPAPAPERDAAAPKLSKRPPAAAPVRTEPKPETARQPQAAQAAPTPPTGSLQLALPMSPADLVRHVREQIGEAQANLGRVDYLALSADGKSQYDTAKRFIEQAEQALREKNLVFAAKVAEKAAGLAASLAGRQQPLRP